jgi:hypothetical protein
MLYRAANTIKTGQRKRLIVVPPEHSNHVWTGHEQSARLKRHLFITDWGRQFPRKISFRFELNPYGLALLSVNQIAK